MCRLSKLKKLFTITLLTISTSLFAFDDHPFDYDLHLSTFPGKNQRTMICFHGMGADYKLAKYIQQISQLEDNFVGFNFTDHEISKQLLEPENTIYGTIEDLLPAAYVLKKIIIDEGKEAVNLYAFSMGGASLINTLVMLHTDKYDSYLEKIEITSEIKAKILDVLRKGYILLDCPLKSMREVITMKGANRWSNPIGARFAENNLEPIDSLEYLHNLGMNFFVHFQKNDEYFSNRDDELYIERLKKFNQGWVKVTSNGDEGHKLPHNGLWLQYHLQQQEQYPLVKENKRWIVGYKIRTSNETQKDEGATLWHKILSEDLLANVPHRVSGAYFGVYCNYELDYTKPYDYIVGCEVSSVDQIPQGMVAVKIPKGKYGVFQAEGSFPQSVFGAWKKVWASPLKRTYDVDYEFYPENFQSVENPSVEVHISAKG